MEKQPVNNTGTRDFALRPLIGNQYITPAATTDDFHHLLRQLRLPGLEDIIAKLTSSAGKKASWFPGAISISSIPTETIALFYIRYEAAMILCFDRQEYFVDYTLEQVQSLLPGKQFYRLNRQYLINFNAIKEVEHYFSRKLLVNAVIPTKDKLIVSKDKVSAFLDWLDSR